MGKHTEIEKLFIAGDKLVRSFLEFEAGDDCPICDAEYVDAEGWEHKPDCQIGIYDKAEGHAKDQYKADQAEKAAMLEAQQKAVDDLLKSMSLDEAEGANHVCDVVDDLIAAIAIAKGV